MATLWRGVIGRRSDGVRSDGVLLASIQLDKQARRHLVAWLLGMAACSCVEVTRIDSDAGTLYPDGGFNDAKVAPSTRTDRTVETTARSTKDDVVKDAGETTNPVTTSRDTDNSETLNDEAINPSSTSRDNEQDSGTTTNDASTTNDVETSSAQTARDAMANPPDVSSGDASVLDGAPSDSGDASVDTGERNDASEPEATSPTTSVEAGVVGPIGDAGAVLLCGVDAGFDWCVSVPEASPLCGNGVLDTVWDEDCDDGNTEEWDGCDNCKVERNWRCDEGEPCVWLLADRECTNGCFAGDTCIEIGSGVTCACPAQQPTACGAVYFRSLPTLGNVEDCHARATSDDGATIVGTCFEGEDSAQIPVAWRSSQLPARLRESGSAQAVNADGSLIAISLGFEPFVLLPPNEPATDVDVAWYPRAMNATGTIVVGDSFIWTQADGAIPLYSPDGDFLRGDAADIAELDTAQGGPIVGSARDDEGGTWAAVWTLDGVGTWLPNPEGATATVAETVSPDGTMIIGKVWFEDGYATMRWNSSGIESVDPPVVVGSPPPRAWLFDDTETRTLEELLTDLGVSLDNWGPLAVSDRSRDGHVIVGAAQYLGSDQSNSNFRPFVITLP